MVMNPEIGSEYDLIIIGSGAGAMGAALVARSLGKRPVIFEKLDKVGGTTAFSGGVCWVPDNSLLAEVGIEDSYDRVRTYFDQVVTYPGKAVTRERTDAFLKGARKAFDFLRDRGLKLRRPYHDWPDYHDSLPGGEPQGRSLMAEPFDIAELGEWKQELAMYAPLEFMPMGADEFTTLFLMKRTWAGKRKALTLVGRIVADKLRGRQTMFNGAALQGRLLQMALAEKVEIHRGTPATRLLMEDGRVTGVVVERQGREHEVRATGGVIVNAGGFSRDFEFRQKVTDGPVTKDGTNVNLADTGDMLKQMVAIGADTDCLDHALWVCTSRNVDGSWPEGTTGKDGSHLPFLHNLDLAFPHSILVDQLGKRFVNESGDEMEVGDALYTRNRETNGKAIPAWVIFDKRHRDRYPWGSMPPGKTPKSWIDSGYMKKADTLEELARQCGIDAGGLAEEIRRFNAFCATGRDEDFARGHSVSDRAHGDPTVRPNPNLGAIEQGPFYAVAFYPGDVGTAGGVVTDQYARVVTVDGEFIPGIYAVGNTAASVFGRHYPGPGGSLASAITFGYIAALHALQRNSVGVG